MASFAIKGKVAIVTGGASGLGLQYALQLLKKGAKGVAIGDVSPAYGREALTQIENKFGKDKAIFSKTDVTDYTQFEDLFKKTTDTFKNVDILINNAGIMDDSVWQREIAINLNGTINGILLGLENYIQKHKSGNEGLIVNISSIAGISPFPLIPIYTATKFGIHGLCLAWGHDDHYKRTKVRVVGVCPGVSMTPLILERANKNLGPEYEKLDQKDIKLPIQNPEQVGPLVIDIIEKAPSGTMWVVEGGMPPYQFQLADRFKQPAKTFL